MNHKKYNIAFEDGILIIPDIKKVEGDLHERINKRYKIVMFRNFMLRHTINLNN